MDTAEPYDSQTNDNPNLLKLLPFPIRRCPHGEGKAHYRIERGCLRIATHVSGHKIHFTVCGATDKSAIIQLRIWWCHEGNYYKHLKHLFITRSPDGALAETRVPNIRRISYTFSHPALVAEYLAEKAVTIGQVEKICKNQELINGLVSFSAGDVRYVYDYWEAAEALISLVASAPATQIFGSQDQ